MSTVPYPPDEIGARDEAQVVLVHYFKTAFQAAGLNWNADNEQEVESAIDAIIRAAAHTKGQRP